MSLVPTYTTLEDTITLASGTLAAAIAVGYDDLPITVAGTAVKGTAMSDAVAGDDVTLLMEGIVPAVAAAALAKGVQVASDATGKMRLAVTGDNIFGRTKAANLAANDRIAVYVTREGVRA